MNFTREPIIETIITPKEGFKLVVRNTKGNSSEEYVVDAIEVVSFGHSFFFRSLERPKSFLVPVSDYEIAETKETRVVLKNASFERNIKIGGGAKVKEKPAEEEGTAAVEEKLEKKRERRRHRRRRPTDDKPEEPKTSEKPEAEGGGADDETKVSSSLVTRLIPPPPGLISDSFAKPKAETPPEAEGDVFPEPVKEEKPKRGRRKKTTEDTPPKAEEETPPKAEEEKPPQEDNPSPEGGDAQRVAIETPEVATTTSFSTVEKPSFFGKIW